MTTSSAQLRRLFKLVPYLQQHQGVTVAEAAAQFDVTPKQIITDLEVLQFCGMPEGMYDDLFDVDLEGAREDGHIFFRNADVLRRPMRMRLEEATSLLIALQAVVEVSGGSAAAQSALVKLHEVLGGVDPAIHVDVAGGNAEHRQALQRAIEARRLVRLDHRGAGRSGASQPVVEPMRLRVVDGFTYLDGWSRLRDDWRSYRLDRIDAVADLGEGFDPRPGLADAADGWFGDAAAQLTLVVDQRATWISEYFPTTAVTRTGDAVEVTFPVGSSEWATSLVLRLGEQVRAISDDAVATAARAEASAALAHYSGPST